MAKTFRVYIALRGGPVPLDERFDGVDDEALADMRATLLDFHEALDHRNLADPSESSRVPILVLHFDVQELGKDGVRHAAPRLFRSDQTVWYDLSYKGELIARTTLYDAFKNFMGPVPGV